MNYDALVTKVLHGEAHPVDAAKAISELAERALEDAIPMPTVCDLIGRFRQVGIHTGPPLGWFGADALFLSGQQDAIRELLSEMNDWSLTEQEDLVRHWAGKGGLVKLTKQLVETYAWQPKYHLNP